MDFAARGVSVSTSSLDGSGRHGADRALAGGLARWLTARRGLQEVEIGDLSRPAAGYSGETIFVDVASAGDTGSSVTQLVLRLVPREAATFAEFDLLPQWEAQIAASHVGVPVPDPVLEPDPKWLGRPFIAMPRVEGHVVGGLQFRDPWLSGLSSADQRRVHDGMLAALVTIHRADPNEAPRVPRLDNQGMLRFWEHYLSWSTHGRPVPTLVEAIEWAGRHLPRHEPPAALLWGDVRLENMVLGDDLVPRAVLDWDMTTVGAPEHDLAWLTSLDLTAQQMFGTRVEGFPDRDDSVAHFEHLSGRSVRDLEWYETLAMLRSTAIMTRISILRQDAGKSPMLPIEDNPILDLLRGRLR